MLAAAVIRNLSDLTGRYEVFFQRNRCYGQRVAVDLPVNGTYGPEIVAAQRTGTAAGGNAAGADCDDALFARFIIFNLMGRDYEPLLLTLPAAASVWVLRLMPWPI